MATVVRDGLLLSVPVERSAAETSKLKRLERKRKYDRDLKLVSVLREAPLSAEEEPGVKAARRSKRAKAKLMMRPEAGKTLLQSYAVAEKSRA